MITEFVKSEWIKSKVKERHSKEGFV
jgi:hypothetical protein